MPRGPRPRLRHGAHDFGARGNRRAQYRPLSGRRGDLRRAGRDGPRDARGDGRGSRLRGAAMIIGIGSDLCDIRRIEETLGKFGDRFVAGCFTAVQRGRSERRAARGPSDAKRFAAKEACPEALGPGMSHGVFWRDMGVVNLPSGKPTMQLTGGAAARLAGVTPEGTQAMIHLTITDETPLAQAFVVIEARPSS